MTTNHKAAGGGDSLTAYENVRAKQRDRSACRTESVSFILPIDARYRLTADEYAWRIERRKGMEGEWRPIEWHSTINTAVSSLSQRLIRTSKVRTLADALAAVENVSRRLTLALAPSYKVERRL